MTLTEQAFRMDEGEAQKIEVPAGGLVDLISYSAIVFTIGLFSSGL